MKPIKKKLFALYDDEKKFDNLIEQMLLDVRWDISEKLFNNLHDRELMFSQRIVDSLVNERKKKKKYDIHQRQTTRARE
jgi:hypothetical protein